MLTDIGEYIVGAYLKLEMQCDFVDYNVRPPGGGLKGLGELDVVGLDTTRSVAHLCEVTTHILGLMIGGSVDETINKLVQKRDRQREYAAAHLKAFKEVRYSYWSPVVTSKALLERLQGLEGVELVINGEYKRRVEMLRARARRETHDARNPVFRMLQILEHLRD